MAARTMFRVVERNARVWRRLWRGSISTSFLIPLLFLAAMGLGLGGLVDDRTGRVEGLRYLEFVAPALLAAGAAQAAAGESLWPVMAGTKWIRFYHAMVATPVSAADVFGGVVVWTAVRTAIGASAFLLVATAFGAVRSPEAVLAVPATMACAAAFAAPLTAFAATQQTDFRFSVVIRLGVVPMFLFSGTFFPVDQLPAALEALAMATPLWHGIELCRDATTGTLRPGPLVVHAAVLAAFIAAGWRWGTRAFTRALSA